MRRRTPISVAGLSLLLAISAAGCGSGSHAAGGSAARGGATGSSGSRAYVAGRTRLERDELRAIERVLRYTDYVSIGSPRRMDIALTFDDGPGPQTPQLLELLRTAHVPATFFQIGSSISRYRAAARAELARGLPIGDHTATHPFLTQLSAAAQRRQILDAASAIAAYGAPYPRLFRPPYGGFDAATLAITRAARMLMVLWTVDTRDFSQPGVKKIVYTALSGARPGAIILMHDGPGPRPQTLAALPRIIRVLRRRHFHLVTVPRLILDDPPPPGQPPPHSLSGH